MMKTKACTEGKRHTWTWLNNCTKAVISGRGAKITLRGRYICACGALKFGSPNHDGPDLRGIIGSDVFVSSAAKKSASPKSED